MKKITLSPAATIFYDDQTKVLLTDQEIVEIDTPIGNRTQIALSSGHLLLVKEPPAEAGTGAAADSGTGSAADSSAGAKTPETPPPEPHSGAPPPDPPPTETAPKGNKKRIK
jgi:hypothetical protein